MNGLFITNCLSFRDQNTNKSQLALSSFWLISLTLSSLVTHYNVCWKQNVGERHSGVIICHLRVWLLFRLISNYFLIVFHIVLYVGSRVLGRDEHYNWSLKWFFLPFFIAAAWVVTSAIRKWFLCFAFSFISSYFFQALSLQV